MTFQFLFQQRLQKVLADAVAALLHGEGELAFEQVEAAVLNVARFDTNKLSEAAWTGQVARALRVLDGLRHEGETPVMVHWTLAEDLRALARARAALGVALDQRVGRAVGAGGHRAARVGAAYIGHSPCASWSSRRCMASARMTVRRCSASSFDRKPPS